MICSVNPLCVDTYHNALAPENLRRVAYQLGIFHSLRIYGNLVCSRAERVAKIFYRGDPSTDTERYKDLRRRFAYNVEHKPAPLV